MRDKLTKFAIMTIMMPGLIMIAVLGSATNHILMEYADYPVNIATMVITIPTLAVMIGLLLSPVLSKKVPAKIVVVSGLVLYSGAAVTGYFAKSIYLLLFLRALQGIGAGVILPQQATYSATYPEEERATIMGLSTAVSAVFSVVVIILSGFVVARYGWRSSLLLYLITLIPLIFAIFFLPMHVMPLNGTEEEKDDCNKKDTESKVQLLEYWPVVMRYLLYAALLCCVYGIVGVEFSQYLVATGMGGSEVSGLLLGTGFGGTILAGFVSGHFLAMMKRQAISVLFLINAIGCFLMWLAPNLILAILAALFFGVACGFASVVCNFEMSRILPLQVFTAISAVFGLSSYVMQFFGPMIYSGVMNTLGQGSFRITYLIYGIVMLIVFCFTLADSLRSKKHTNQK